MKIKSDKTSDYPLRSIYFYPTETCNLRCIHCWIQPSYASDEISYQKLNQENVSVATMERVVRDALPLGLNHIKFTGGEPFLNPGLFDFLEAFAQSGLSFAFETNGTLLTEGIVKRLKEYNLKQISVSLDGSVPEVHERIRGVKGSFEKAVNGIELLIRHEISPQVILCFQKANAHDLANTIQLAHRLGVRSFEINPLSLMRPKALKPKLCEGLPVEGLLALERKVEGELTTRFPDMHINLYLPPALKGIKELSRRTLYTCRILNICGILSNGDVSICGIGSGNKDLIMGNVKEKSIARIWEEGLLFKGLREKLPFELNGICGRCLFKLHCLGFCRADVVATHGSMTDPYGLCEEVFQKGLFPNSRILSEGESASIKDNALR